MIPRLMGLGRGIWRLLWLGRLRVSNDNPSGYEIQVHFAWAGSGQKPPVSIWQPLTHLSFLRLQSLWENDFFRGDHPAHERTFSVLAGGASLSPPWRPYERGADLLSVSDYNFHRIRELADCWVFRTSSGEEIIVPVWEILRAWYLFCPEIMPAILAGAVRHLEAIPYRLQPWLEGTGLLPDGRPQFVRAQWISDAQAKRLARLLFVDIAEEQTYRIYSHLMASSTNVWPSDSPRMIDLPAVLPPYHGSAQWNARCLPLSAGPDGARRWLTLSLEGANLPCPFADLVIVRENDGRQGMNRNDPNLSEYRRRRSAVKPGIHDAVTLTAAGADSSVEDTHVGGFDFVDDIVDSVRTVLLDKPMQGWRAVGTPSEPLSSEEGSTDAAAPSRPRHTRVRTDGVRLSMSSDALFRLSLEAFRSLVSRAAAQPATCHARLIAKGGDGEFAVRSRYSNQVRQFAILQFEMDGRIVYALDAERLRSGESFSLLLCRSSGFYRLTPALFEEWLGRFPAERFPWRGMEILPRDLVVDDFLHQPQRDGLDALQIRQQLEQRLLSRLQRFVSG